MDKIRLPEVEPAGARPEPPEHLSPEAQEEWRAIVADVKAGYFPRHTWPALGTLCELVATQHYAAQQMRRLEQEAQDGQGLDIVMHGYYDQLHTRQASQIGNLMTKLRLTQQSSQHPETKRTRPQGKPPWEQ